MLVDTKKLHTVKTAPQGPAYSPSDYERAPEVYVFRMTWDGEDRGDMMNYADVLEFVMELDGDEDATEEDVRQWLDSGRAIRFGTDEEWYRVAPLEYPQKLDYFGELVPEDEPFYPDRERATGPTGSGFPYTWKI